MDWQGRLSSVFPRSDSISRPLLTVLLVYSFSSQFLPIEPYLVPYLTTVKDFTNYQVLPALPSYNCGLFGCFLLATWVVACFRVKFLGFDWWIIGNSINRVVASKLLLLWAETRKVEVTLESLTVLALNNRGQITYMMYIIEHYFQLFLRSLPRRNS